MLWQTVSLFSQYFECLKWENHVFVEFLPFLSSAVLRLETQVLMPVSDFSGFCSRNHLLEGAFTFNGKGGRGVDFQLGGGFIFKWGEAPSGWKSHRMMGGGASHSWPLSQLWHIAKMTNADSTVTHFERLTTLKGSEKKETWWPRKAFIKSLPQNWIEAAVQGCS